MIEYGGGSTPHSLHPSVLGSGVWSSDGFIFWGGGLAPYYWLGGVCVGVLSCTQCDFRFIFLAVIGVGVGVAVVVVVVVVVLVVVSAVCL